MRSREPSDDDRRAWAVVVAGVQPLPGKLAPPAPQEPRASAPAAKPPPPRASAGRQKRAAAPPPPAALPRRRLRRLASRREWPQKVVDLHDHDQDTARLRLTRELIRAVEEGARVILVITGKGRGGVGVLRRRVPEWLAEPPLRPLISGLDVAHHRHGGEGALYVALKRRP